MWCWGLDHQILNIESHTGVSELSPGWPGLSSVLLSGCCGDDLCSQLCAPLWSAISPLFPCHFRVTRNNYAASMPCCGLCKYVLQLFLLWDIGTFQDFTRTINWSSPLFLKPIHLFEGFATSPRLGLRNGSQFITDACSHYFFSDSVPFPQSGEYFSSLFGGWGCELGKILLILFSLIYFVYVLILSVLLTA